MPVTTAPLAPSTLRPPFPAAAVEACLRSELIDIVKAEAQLSGVVLPKTTSAICGATIQIDSLSVVSILCAVEPIVGMELPDQVVRSGGYRSVDQAVSQLVREIEKQWNRKGSK